MKFGKEIIKDSIFFNFDYRSDFAFTSPRDIAMLADSLKYQIDTKYKYELNDNKLNLISVKQSNNLDFEWYQKVTYQRK